MMFVIFNFSQLYQRDNWLSQISDVNSVSDVTYSSVITPQKTIVTLSSHGNRTTALLRHRDADKLPTAADTADDLDNLDDLLQHIGHTSPECLQEVRTMRFINSVIKYYYLPVLKYLKKF